MSELCRFRGIVIVMFFDDHPTPHFHVKYAEHRAAVSIDRLQIFRGSLPTRAQQRVLEWARARQPELQAAWSRAEQHQEPGKIAPLD